LTISPTKSQSLQSTKFEEHSSINPFLEKGKMMQELKAKLLSKRTTTQTSQAKKFVTFDIYDPFFSEYQKTTELAY